MFFLGKMKILLKEKIFLKQSKFLRILKKDKIWILDIRRKDVFLREDEDSS